MNIIDNDIAMLYKIEFSRSLHGSDIYCSLIHYNKILCLIHCQREVIQAMELCFKDNKIPTSMKENEWSKCLLINIDNVPAIPPFENLKKHYIKCFLDRLLLIEQWFDKHSISYSDLLSKKNTLLNKKTIKYIQLQSLRNLYESKRNDFIYY
tara:strand:+ start:10492 stop:10947 length:456 start_codon:yes stop_codon:yes gene_type:complete